jgi:dihydrodipicolinate synthase/N-acetylneuraminate lyase
VSAGFQIIVPIVTPYGVDGGVDLEALAAHAAVLAEGGVDGFFVCGTNGEGPLLGDDEVVDATRAVARAAPGRLIVSQVGRPSTCQTGVLLERCIEAGATAAAVVTPYFFELTDDGAREHYGTLVRAAGEVPVFAYVIPSYAHNDLSPALVAELAADGLAGIKDSTKSRERHEAYVAIRKQAGDRAFETFVGDDSMTLDALGMGSSGAVPALANVRPELFAELVAAMEAGDDARAQDLQAHVTGTRRALRSGGIATLKHHVREMLAGRGIAYPEAVRSPLPRHGTEDRA